MGTVLVLYHSDSGNTAKMAQHVAEGVHSVENTDLRKRTIDQANAGDLRWCNGLALGAPTNLGSISWRMKQWWDELPEDLWSTIDGKIGCAFSSSGGWGGGAELACMALMTVMMNYGFLVFGVTDYVEKRFTLHYGAVLAGEPRREREKRACRRLGQRLAERVAVFTMGAKISYPSISNCLGDRR
jgi:NAD(P)H dehydrogenase (quinone)